MWILLTALRSFARSGPLQTGHSTLTFSLLLMSPFTPAPCIQHYQDGECVLEPRPVIISFTQQNWTLIPVERVWHSNTDMQAMLDRADRLILYNKYYLFIQVVSHLKLEYLSTSSPKVSSKDLCRLPNIVPTLIVIRCVHVKSDTYSKWKLRLKLNKV